MENIKIKMIVSVIFVAIKYLMYLEIVSDIRKLCTNKYLVMYIYFD